MPRIVRLALISLAAGLGACASVAPHGNAGVWEGRSPHVVKVRLRSASAQLPASAWLAETTRERADGHVRFTKWNGGSYRYSASDWYALRERWDKDSHFYGLIQTRNGVQEFCTLNPELGAFEDGDRVGYTYNWDYCAPLRRR